MPKIAKYHAYKEKEFGIYVLWKFLPAHFKGMRKNELAKLGFNDPVISKIIKIKNQTEFAKYFNIKDLGTLTDWNKKIKNENITHPPIMDSYQKNQTNINEKIILPSITELKENLLKQNKLIATLKKENAYLKNKLKLRPSTKKENNISTKSIRSLNNQSKIKIEEDNSKLQISETIFQKLFNRFLKK